MHISQKVKGVLMRNLQHIIIGTKILADFQICISAPLKYSNLFTYLNLQIDLFMNTFALIFDFNTLSANPTNWSNTLKQFVGYC